MNRQHPADALAAALRASDESATRAVRLARFEIVRSRRGVAVEWFCPNLAREWREEVRELVAAMREDARRWGGEISVRRVGAGVRGARRSR